MFSIEEMTGKTKLKMTVTDVTVLDSRTGEKTKHRFYRPGNAFPYKEVAERLAEYGYKVIATEGIDYIDGTISWKAVYTDFVSNEESAG